MAQNEYEFLTRLELLDQLKFNQSELTKLRVKAEPTEAADKEAVDKVKAEFVIEIGKIKAALKATMAAPPGGPLAPPMEKQYRNW